MDSYFMVDIKMNQEKERQYREEFVLHWRKEMLISDEYIDHFRKLILRGELVHRELKAYLSGRKKGDAEVKDLNFQLECAQAVGVSYGKTIDRMEKEIAQLKAENELLQKELLRREGTVWNTQLEATQGIYIEQLKEQLKWESEFVNRIASNGLDVPVTVELMKRARSIQEQRKNL